MTQGEGIERVSFEKNVASAVPLQNGEAQRTVSLDGAYKLCKTVAQSHYENFTVVTRFLPKWSRKYVYALYAYCRYTDDLGDEISGDRLEKLNRWERKLKGALSERGTPDHPILIAVQDMTSELGLPQEQFKKLIEANRIDQRRSTYQTYQEIVDYCEHSANPVGRLFLSIFDYHSQDLFRLSDKTCTGLQLTNFWQDVYRDLEKGRVYIPQEDMNSYGYSIEELQNREYNCRFKKLMKFEVQRARGLLEEGLQLPDLLDRTLQLDVRLFNLGGLAILDKIESLDYNVLDHRPTVSKFEKTKLLLGELIKHRLRCFFA
ncbi:MAG: squalene synthase HpnC [Candidatus Acetothermia bacterium]